MMTNKMSTILKAITPPFLQAQVKKIRSKRVTQDACDPEKDCNASWYDDVFRKSPDYNVHYSRSEYYFLWCVLVDRVMRYGSQFVLDIGCGPGQLASFLRDKGLKRYTGIDLSTVAVNKARKLCPDYQFIATNALESNIYETADYDTVISLEFLEHVREDISVLERLLTGSRFLGTVPNFDYLSHVRYFSSCDEVINRYSSLFHNFTVDEFQSPNGNHVFFLLDGTRK